MNNLKAPLYLLHYPILCVLYIFNDNLFCFVVPAAARKSLRYVIFDVLFPQLHSYIFKVLVYII